MSYSPSIPACKSPGMLEPVETQDPSIMEDLQVLRASLTVPRVVTAMGPGDGEKPVENGSGDLTSGVGSTGNQGIDGLLSGIRWSDGAITYSFPSSDTEYGDTHPEFLSNFQQLNTAQQLAVHFALNTANYGQPMGAAGFSVAGFTNLGITNVSGGAGTIRLSNTSDPGTAYAYYPSSGVWGGDAFFGPSGQTPVMGNYHWHTVLHELGHSLGLKHGQETSTYGAMPSNLDAMEYSVMTYRSYVGGPTTGYTNETYGYAQTYMMYDIAALQHMYGADFTSNSGNTTYRWDPVTGTTYVNGMAAITPGGNRIFMTVWDGNGIDTYDLSAYTTGVNVNLNPGSSSLLSSVQQAYLGYSYGTSGYVYHYASGNVYNALLYNNDTRSLIENAIGGSGDDTLIGNQAANMLNGGNGDDRLEGGAGNDTIYGGSGNDTIYGGGGRDLILLNIGNDIFHDDATAGDAGSDTIYGGFGNDTINCAGGNDALYGDQGNDSLRGGAGNDTLAGGAGMDTLVGGAGDDVYLTDGSDVLHELAGEGDDLVQSTANHILAANFERLILVGTAISGTGNALANRITGNALANRLDGGAGADTLIGGAGADTLIGGAGNDHYITDGFDTIIEAVGGGIDTVHSAVSLMLAANLEYLMLTGTANISGIGNALANQINGNANANRLDGGWGNDTLLGGGGNDTLLGQTGNDRLDGGLGNDVLTGGAGADTLVFRAGADRITDFADNVDTIALDDALWGGAPRTVAQLVAMATVVSGGVLFNFGNGNTLLVENLASKSHLLDDLIIV